MKKLFTLVALALIAGSNANAQSLLRGLGNAAKQAVEKKISDAANGKNNRAQEEVTATETAAPSASSMSARGNSAKAEDFEYAQELISEEYSRPDWDLDIDEDDLDLLPGKSFKDALGFTPAMPKAADVINEEGVAAFNLTMTTAVKSAEKIALGYMSNVQEWTKAKYNAAPAPAAKGNAKAVAPVISVEEIMAAFQAKGLNIATATEEQTNDVAAELVAKKMGISKAEALKLMQEDEDQPKTRAEEIAEELTQLQMKQFEDMAAAAQAASANLMAIFGGGVQAGEEGMSGALAALSKKIVKGWAKSEECKKVNQMEMELDAKLQEWMKSNNTGYNDNFPDWWTKGREEQNKVIDAYNEKSMEKWIETVMKHIKKDQADAEHLVELDSELDAMSAADKNTEAWYDSKITLASLNGVILSYIGYPKAVFDCPLVSHVATTTTF